MGAGAAPNLLLTLLLRRHRVGAGKPRSPELRRLRRPRRAEPRHVGPRDPQQLLRGLLPGAGGGRAGGAPLRPPAAGAAAASSSSSEAGGAGRAPRAGPLQLPAQGARLRPPLEPRAPRRRQRRPRRLPPLRAPPGARGTARRQLIGISKATKAHSLKAMEKVRQTERNPRSIQITPLQTGSTQGPPGKRDALTPSIRRWNWKRSFCSICISLGTVDTRWPDSSI